MKTIYDPTLKANVTLDDAGHVRGINHVDEYPEIEHVLGREAAAAYVRDIAGKLNITQEALHSLEQAVTYVDPQEKDVEYRFSEEKGLFHCAPTPTTRLISTCQSGRQVSLPWSSRHPSE